MSTDLTIMLDDQPGAIADLGETMGEAGIDILGGCGFPCEGRGVMHLLVGDFDAERAETALTEAGFEVVARRPVLLESMPAGVGSLGNLTRRLADAGVNVDLLYVADGARLVLGCDDLGAARQAL